MEIEWTQILTIRTPGMVVSNTDDSLDNVPTDPTQRDARNMDPRLILLELLVLKKGLAKYLLLRFTKATKNSRKAITIIVAAARSISKEKDQCCRKCSAPLMQ